MGFWHLLFHLLLMFLTSSSLEAAEASIVKSGCPDKCGNVSIPYPFGIKDGCFREDQEGFQVSCNDTYDPPKPFLGDFDLLEISLKGEATVATYVASDCYNQSGCSDGYYSSLSFSERGPFTFSNTRNKFTAIGCDTQAYITGSSERNFTSGCLSFCWDKESVQTKNCSGIGCCRTSIPDGVKSFDITVNSSNDHSKIMDFNPCSYAFLIKEDGFEFNLSDLTSTGRYSPNSTQVPVVVDWAIGNETCESALKNSTSYACKSMNSNCYNSTNGPGYRCKCSQGFQGNPYLEQGCKGTMINCCFILHQLHDERAEVQASNHNARLGLSYGLFYYNIMLRDRFFRFFSRIPQLGSRSALRFFIKMEHVKSYSNHEPMQAIIARQRNSVRISDAP